MTVPLYNLTDTWNNGATIFTAIKMNVTDSASDAESVLMDLQVGGNSVFKIRKDGQLFVHNEDWTVGSKLFLYRTYVSDSNFAGLRIDASGNGAIFSWDAFGAALGIPQNLQFNSTGNVVYQALNFRVYDINSNLVFSYEDGDGTLNAGPMGDIFQQKRSTHAQTFRVYNTYTDASNYERGGLDWATTANTLRIRSENLGTGTNRIIAIDGFSKAGAAANTDIPNGTWALIRDTSGLTTKLVYNNGGTLQSVALT